MQEQKDSNSNNPIVKKKQTKYYVGQNLDVKDSVNKWVNAQVLYCDEKQIYVHYSGYSQKYDQYIFVNSDRILQQWQPNKQIKLYNRVDGYHPIGGWLQARVVQKQKDPQYWYKIKLHFFNYDKKYDRWVDIRDKNQIAIIGSKTKAYGIGKKRAKNNMNKKRILSQAALKALRQKLVKFIQTLQEKKWVMKDIEGDGNCLFRSISHQLYGDDSFHSQIRSICMKYIYLQRGFFQDYIIQDIEEYIQRKRKNGEWGDDVQIQAISEIYGRPIEIYAFGDKPIRTFHEDNSQQVQPIRMAFVGHCHYNSIYKNNSENSSANENQIEKYYKGLMENRKFGQYQTFFFNTFEENRQKIIQNRQQFANTNTVQQFIDQHFEAQNRDVQQVIKEQQSQLAKILQISQNQEIMNQIQQAQIKEVQNRAQMQKLQQDLKRLQQKEIAEALKNSAKDAPIYQIPIINLNFGTNNNGNINNNHHLQQPPKPYWYNDLLAQGFSQQEINYAIEVNGYDPDTVQNFLLDNTFL